MVTLRRMLLSWSFAIAAGVMLAAVSALPRARADARSDYLIQLLTGSGQFRVRAQAAISLGGVDADEQVLSSLIAALRDEHPAVRAAAANSLGRLAHPSSSDALRAATSDREEPVRTAARAALVRVEASARGPATAPRVPAASGPPRFYVAVGRPSSRSNELSQQDLDRAREVLRARASELDGVMLAPADEAPASAEQVLRKQKLQGYYLESSITSIEQKPGGGVRAAVSVILATYPGRDMRAVTQGAATVSGGGDLKTQALEAAFRSALRQLPAAMSRN